MSRLKSRCATVLLLAFLAVAGARANGDQRAYSAGPLTGDDFQQTPPTPRPTHNGSELKAEVAVGLSSEGKPVSWTTTPQADGSTRVEVTTSAPTASMSMDRSQSWVDPAVKNDPGLLDHEQGHLDVAEKHARELQAEYNRMEQNGELTSTVTLPPGASQAAIDQAIAQTEQKIQNKIDAAFDKASAREQAANADYDTSTGHGLNPEEEKAARARQRADLAKPNTDAASKKGTGITSASRESIDFDASSGLLTIDDDFVTGFDALGSGFTPVPGDPILGAEIVMPLYTLTGAFVDGPFFFSGVDPVSDLVINGSGDELFRAHLPYLLYDARLNLFYGLSGPFAAVGGQSAWVDHLVTQLGSGRLALFGIEFTPDVDFFAASRGFAASATSGATNSGGARRVPEPGSAVLLALATLVVTSRLRRRRVAA